MRLFPPKYCGKVVEGEVADAAEENIREACKVLDNEVIDMAGRRNLERIKPGTVRFITNFLEESVKNRKKSESF